MDRIARLRLPALLENIPRAIDFVSDSARAAGVDQHSLYQIQVAVDEACANVVQHAYEDTKPGDMEITCQCEARGFAIRIHDWGASFDPGTVDDPDVGAALEDRTPGGLGLFLIRRLMDLTQFTFDPVLGNELLMVKRLRVAE